MARELSRVIAKECEKAIGALVQSHGSDRVPAVHAARTRIKKMRAVLRLLQPDLEDDYDVITARLRRIAHHLSSLRDVDASIEVMQALRDHYPRVVTRPMCRAVERGLRGRQHGTVARIDPDRLLPRIARALQRSSTAVRRRVRRVTHAHAIRAGIGRGYRRARTAMACVRLNHDDALFHRWRRRVKEHWYQMRLLEGRHAGMSARVRGLRQLETWLGEDHNLVVLRASILEAPARFGDERTTAVVLGCIAKYQGTLRRRALTSGEQLFARTPSAFRTQIDTAWRKGRPRST